MAREMKLIIYEHIRTRASTMFNDCAKSAKSKLEAMAKEANKMLDDKFVGLVGKIALDYSILTGSRSEQETKQNLKLQRQTKNQILGILKDVPETLSEILAYLSEIERLPVSTDKESGTAQPISDVYVQMEDDKAVDGQGKDDEAEDGQDEVLDEGDEDDEASDASEADEDQEMADIKPSKGVKSEDAKVKGENESDEDSDGGEDGDDNGSDGAYTPVKAEAEGNDD